MSKQLLSVKYLPAISIVCAMLSFSQVSAQKETQRNTNEVLAVAASKESVVNIQGDKIEEAHPGSGESNKAFNGMGTGVLIDPRGYIVTNYHVIDGISNIQVTTADRGTYSAQLVERDPDTDLAIIKISSNKKFPVIKFGDPKDVKLAETVLAIGNPYGYQFTVTKGIVSGLNRDVPVNDKLLYKSAIQTDAAINPGNSGGPLVNLDGEMIGINAAIRQGAECIAFAIPVDTVLEASAKLINQATNKSCSHGIQFRNLHDSLVVNSVDAGSAAEKSGIKVGDLISAVDQKTLERKLDFYRAMIDRKPNETFSVEIVRNDETLEKSLTLSMPMRAATGSQYAARYPQKNTTASGRSNATKTVSKTLDSDAAGSAWDVLGIRATAIPKQEYVEKYKRYLKLYPHGAVVVREVRPGSLLESKGVAVGDVLVGIHIWSTTTPNDLEYIAGNLLGIQNTKTVPFWLFRNGVYYDEEIELR